MFGYVVLHYLDFDTTFKCVSILLENFPDSKVVIVDNASNNGTGEQLAKAFNQFNNVHVLINQDNLGFAKGNNVGFEFAKKEFSLDALAVINNDIYINDKNFEAEILKFMSDNYVDVSGPDIITLNGNHQNPLLLTNYSNKYIKKSIFLNKMKMFFLKSNFFFRLYCKRKENKGPLIKDKKDTIFDCVLHGACVVFSRHYIENEDFAFLPITFMYNEELILDDYLKYKNYKTGYCSETSVSHLEGASTSKSHSIKKDKILFRFKNMTCSLKAQLKERKKYE